MPFSLTEFRKVFLDALAGCPPDAPQQTRDVAVAFAGMRLLSGMWEPLEATREPVRRYLISTNEFETEQTRQASVKRVVEKALQEVMDDDAVNNFIGEKSNDTADLMGACERILRNYLLWILDGYLTYEGTSALSFSAALKNTVGAFSREWSATFATMLVDPGCSDEFFHILVACDAVRRTASASDSQKETEMRAFATMASQIFSLAKTYTPGEGFPRISSS